MTNLTGANILDLIERRSGLLLALVRTESDWRRSFIGLDLQASELRSAEEEVIFQQLRALDKEIASKAPFGKEDLADRKIRAAIEQMAAIQLDLTRSNAIRRSILNRSKFTINALRNLFDSYAPTYAAPADPSAGSIYQENV